MTSRFWAPQRPTMEPDAVVLALLDPDLGNLSTKLLAIHRAGAAACEAVAKGAVPGEWSLVAGMAQVRALVAPTAVDAVAKSMGGSYAGLLVRDVLDDAEQGALDLFRAAVAKGVSPPVAVSRAGAVYGVPMRALGGYAPLAVDPKSSPLALTDAADRALLTWVASVDDQERDEEVGKATDEVTAASPEPRRRPVAEQDWEEKKHPRDRLGQFAERAAQAEELLSPQQRLRRRLGLEGHAPEVVETDQQPTSAPTTRAARATRATRTRATRQRREAAAPAAPQLTSAPGVLQATGQTLSSSLTLGGTQTLSPRTLATNQALTQMQTLAEPPSTELAPWLGDIPFPQGEGWMKPFSRVSSEDYGIIGVPLFATMNPLAREQMFANAEMVEQKSTSNHGVYRIRAGHLSNTGVSWDHLDAPESLQENENLDKQVKLAGELAKAELGDQFVPAHTYDIDISRAGASNAWEISDAIRSKYPDEVSEHIISAVDYRAYGKPVVVHLPPKPGTTPGTMDYDDRALPVVDVLIIVGSPYNGVAGSHEFGTADDPQAEFNLDPNQVLEFTSAFVPVWDSKRKVMMRVRYLKAVDEDDIGKADDEQPQRQAAAARPPRKPFAPPPARDPVIDMINRQLAQVPDEQFEQAHPRDRLGQFVDRYRQSRVAPTALTEPVQETQVRATRATRATRSSRQRQRREAPSPSLAAELTPLQLSGSQRLSTFEPALQGQQLEGQGIQGARELDRLQGLSRLAQTQPKPKRAPQTQPSKVTVSGEGYGETRVMGLLHPTSRYQHYTLTDFHQTFGTAADGERVLELRGDDLDKFMFNMVMGPTEVLDVIGARLRLDVFAKDGPPMSKKGTPNWNLLTTIPAVKGIHGEGGAEQVAAELLRKNPDVNMISIQHRGRMMEFYGNWRAAQPQVVLEITPDVDMSQPVRLVPVGDIDTTDLLISRMDSYGYLSPAPKMLMPYAAPVRRYQVEQIPDPGFASDHG